MEDPTEHHTTFGMSQPWVDCDNRGECDPGRRQLLAMHGMRRHVECVADAGECVRGRAMEITSTQLVRELRELVAAVDRRLPQVRRAGEAAIARDAAALKSKP